MKKNRIKKPLLMMLAGAIAMAVPAAETPKAKLREATFAGGCFWCMQPPFKNLPGVVSAKAGYTGGSVKNPTYEQVSSGETGHYESVDVWYDPAKINYEKLLDVYWENIDPTQSDGQFVDVGPQYRSVIFYHDEAQKKAAEASKRRLAASGRFKAPIVTQILPALPFYPAEAYHQDFYKKNPARYQEYHAGSGRDEFFKRVWGKNR